ncbi:MAG: DNA replication/repair protein RecF [Acidobacteria bacterium]|jgi:DNA replication and repair protein RecF|nr:DNA replication/repair protein RecF [Acidobacteriota bacterium]
MLLELLEAENFRNLHGKIHCGKNLNIIFGENGQGKTNWLEAIYLLATTKSFKTARLQEAIKFDEELALVRGTVHQGEAINRVLQVAVQGNTKILSVNNKRETVQRFLGQLHAVIFNSDELEIVRGNPDARRKFLDGGIVSIYPPFVQTLTDYNRVIRQKNSLLQTAQENKFSVEKVGELLEPWNEQLINLAARIHKARIRFVERLNEVLEKKLFGREEVSIRYASSLEGKGDLNDYAALIAERLKMRVQAELVSGYSLIGTHRDDLDILFDGHDLRKYGSSGQQRSALLILQLANLSVYYSQHGEYPLFLLDDIDAELDYGRIGQLLDFLEDKTQTFVTTSKESFVEKFSQTARVFTVSSGKVTEPKTNKNAHP